MNDTLRRLSTACYAIALYYLITPIIDLVATGYANFSPGDEVWRWQFAGLSANYIVSFLFAVLTLAVIAALRGHRTVLRLTALLSGLLALCLTVQLLLFFLDIIQLSGTAVASQQSSMFKMGSAKTALKIGLAAVVLIIVAVGSMRSARDIAEEAPVSPLLR